LRERDWFLTFSNPKRIPAVRVRIAREFVADEERTQASRVEAVPWWRLAALRIFAR
jgi:hypothetical protein